MLCLYFRLSHIIRNQSLSKVAFEYFVYPRFDEVLQKTWFQETSRKSNKVNSCKWMKAQMWLHKVLGSIAYARRSQMLFKKKVISQWMLSSRVWQLFAVKGPLDFYHDLQIFNRQDCKVKCAIFIGTHT